MTDQNSQASLAAASASPAATAPTSAQAAPAAAVSAQPPAGPLAAFWDQTKGALDTDKLAAAYTERDNVFALHAERAKDIPEKPDAYKAEPILPDGVKMPDGAKLEFDPKAVGAAGAIAHSLGVTQKGFNQLLGIYAAHQIQAAQASMAEHQTMLAAENAKLGEGGPARRQAIEAFAGAQGFTPDETSEMRLLLSTAAGVSFLEKLIARANGSGIPSHPAHQPATPAPQSIEQRWYGPQQKAS